MKKSAKKDLLIILPVKNSPSWICSAIIIILWGRIFLVFFSFLERNFILFLVSHEKFKTEKNATCNDCKLNYVPLLAALSETRTVISILRNRKYSKQPIKPRIVDFLGFLNKNKVLGSYLSAVYYLWKPPNFLILIDLLTCLQSNKK